jgi:hypothetical protein
VTSDLSMSVSQHGAICRDVSGEDKGEKLTGRLAVSLKGESPHQGRASRSPWGYFSGM